MWKPNPTLSTPTDKSIVHRKASRKQWSAVVRAEDGILYKSQWITAQDFNLWLIHSQDRLRSPAETTFEKVREAEVVKELHNSGKCLNHFFDIAIIYQDASPVPFVTLFAKMDCMFYLVLKIHLFLSGNTANKSPEMKHFIRYWAELSINFNVKDFQ